MKKFLPFSGMKPAVEDLNFESTAKEFAIKKRLIDLTGTGTGILKGILNQGNVFVDIPSQTQIASVDTMHAYIQGEKIEITESQDVTLDDVESEGNIIYLTYQVKNSSDLQALRKHYLTGIEHCVWLEDSFLLTAVKESLYSQSDDKLKLGRVAVVGGLLTVTHDYRTYLKISDEIMNTLVEGKDILFRQPAPPVPTRLRLSTDMESTLRANEIAADSFSPAYIKAEFGDKGTGTASGNVFTKVSSQFTWSTNEWANQYFTDQNGNSFKVVSNTSTVLTLEADAAPVTGTFVLGPNARGYRFILKPLDPSSFEPISVAQSEITLAESPVKQEYIWHGLMPDIKYRVIVASLGGWCQEEQSAFTSPVDIIAGGAKEIPTNCIDAIDSLSTMALDSGIQITVGIKTAYQGKISGLEFAWTDDGTEPDFDNKNHKQIFTKKMTVVLPVKYSTPNSKASVNMKVRLVDHQRRHCTNPYTIPEIKSKEYPADLKDHLASFNEAKELIKVFARGQISWENVRVVAKSGGQYTTITAAINSITIPNTLILVMPGTYEEDLYLNAGEDAIRSIKIMGFRATLYGRIRVVNQGDLSFLGGLKLNLNTALGNNLIEIQSPNYGKKLLISQCSLNAGSIDVPKVAISATNIPLKLLNSFVLGTLSLGNVGDSGQQSKIIHNTFVHQLLLTKPGAGGSNYYDIHRNDFICWDTLACVTVVTGITPTINFTKNRYTVAPATTYGTWVFGAVNQTTNILIPLGNFADDPWEYEV